MKYNFDIVHDRRNTNSVKYNCNEKPEGTLPLWVADMDFQAPKEVLHALEEKSRHGIFGYSDTNDDYFAALHGWFSRRLGWQVQPDWLLKSPGVVYALSTAVRALTLPGDAILIQQPVYYPFSTVVQSNGRKLIVNELQYSNGKYSIDFDDFERKIQENGVRMFLLCSPHNPVGRVWTAEELTQMGDICMRHNVIVVADEIHADFIHSGHKHHVFMNLRPEFAQQTVTCTAPSKTFNLAGLQISNAFIPNRDMRQKMRSEMHQCGYGEPNIMGIVACQAAYTYGESWLEQLLVYLQQNMDFTQNYFQQHMPQVRPVPLEGTYLMWLDCRALGLGDAELNDTIVNKAKLWLNDGPLFGAGGEGFQRFNIACPRETLQLAYRRFVQAFA